MNFLTRLSFFVIYPFMAVLLLCVAAFCLLIFWPLLLHPKVGFYWETKKGGVTLPELKYQTWL